VVLIGGESEIVGEVIATGIHVKLVAPLAVNVTVPPAQSTVEEAAIEMLGAEDTLIAMVSVETQPEPLSPVKV
jgi:hypothetical protein